MSTNATTVATRRPRPLKGKAADLGITAVTYLVAIVLLVGAQSMEVRGKSVPGPTFFPLAVSIFLFAVATIHAIVTVRTQRPEHWHSPDISADMLSDFGAGLEVEGYEQNVKAAALGAKAASGTSLEAEQPDPDTAHPIDWRALGLCLLGLAIFAVTLDVLGWILSAAILFWCGTRAFGSRRALFDVAIALLASSTIQLLFSAGLGLSLPSGFVGRLF